MTATEGLPRSLKEDELVFPASPELSSPLEPVWWRLEFSFCLPCASGTFC